MSEIRFYLNKTGDRSCLMTVFNLFKKIFFLQIISVCLLHVSNFDFFFLCLLCLCVCVFPFHRNFRYLVILALWNYYEIFQNNSVSGIGFVDCSIQKPHFAELFSGDWIICCEIILHRHGRCACHNHVLIIPQGNCKNVDSMNNVH